MSGRRNSVGIPAVSGSRTGGTGDVVYTVDRTDCIIEVNDMWSAFATANDGDSLLPPAILGRVLWDFITEPTTNLVYHQLFDRVRAGVGPVRFQFRCDSPDTRRLLRMTITSLYDGAIRTTVRPVQLTMRAPVGLLDPATPRSEEIVVICAWCKRLPDAGGKWLEIEAAIPMLEFLNGPAVPSLSHGMCDECERSLSRALADPSLAASGSICLGGLGSDAPCAVSTKP